MRRLRWLAIALVILLAIPVLLLIAVGIRDDRDFGSLWAARRYDRPDFTVPVESIVPAAYADAVYLGNLEQTEIVEASGLASSRRREGLLWTLNDSGNEAALYALGTRGEDLGKLELPVANVDWEDLAGFEWEGRPYLMVADVGDNLSWRKTVLLHVIEEPEVPAGGLLAGAEAEIAWTVELRYENGPRDCEAVAVDPLNHSVLLLSKREVPVTLYRVSLLPDLQGETVRVAEPIGDVFHIPQPTEADLEEDPDYGEFRSMTTAMDISPDGRRALVLTYKHTYEFARDEGEPWAEAFGRRPRFVQIPPMQIREALAFDRRGEGFYVTSENRPSPLFHVKRLP